MPAAVSPPYPFPREAGDHRTYVISFPAEDADGVRAVGAPGGSATFTSASEIDGYFE